MLKAQNGRWIGETTQRKAGLRSSTHFGLSMFDILVILN